MFHQVLVIIAWISLLSTFFLWLTICYSVIVVLCSTIFSCFNWRSTHSTLLARSRCFTRRVQQNTLWRSCTRIGMIRSSWLTINRYIFRLFHIILLGTKSRNSFLFLNLSLFRVYNRILLPKRDWLNLLMAYTSSLSVQSRSFLISDLVSILNQISLFGFY